MLLKGDELLALPLYYHSGNLFLIRVKIYCSPVHENKISVKIKIKN